MGKAQTTVTIGSRLPTGLILRHPMDSDVKVTIKGTNSAGKGVGGVPIIIPYATTEVDADFWESWILVHGQKGKEFKALQSGAIFQAKDEASAGSLYREIENRKTGLEGVSQIDKKSGIAPLNTKE